MSVSSPFKKGIDINNTSPDIAQKISLQEVIKPNSLENVTAYRGVILRIEPDLDTSKIQDGSAARMGVRTNAILKAYKIRVTYPENFDAHIRFTQEDFNKFRQGVDSNYYNTLIDLHRTFYAKDTTVKPANVGDEVLIQFTSIFPCENPTYLGPVSDVPAGNGSVSPKTANSPTQVAANDPQPQKLTNENAEQVSVNGDINKVLPKPYLTLEVFRKAFPSAPNAPYLVQIFNEVFDKYNINTPAKISAILAQCAHESGQFRYLEEFGSGDKYNGREDLGNVEAGDGPKFKGRGFIQITGRENYRIYGKKLNVDLINNPTLASDKKIGAELAVLYFKQKGLISLSEKADFKEVTRRINGGYNGYADRVKHYKNILNQYEVEVQV